MYRRRFPAWLAAGTLLILSGAAARAGTPCTCRSAAIPKCPDPAAKHAVTVDVDFAVVDDTVEVVTQSGPYRFPAANLDGKTVLSVFLPRGEVFQGFLDKLVPGGLVLKTMNGTHATYTTNAIFAPGEYELQLFIDANATGGPLAPGPGDLAAFDNTACEPTGASIRVTVGCDDAHVVLGNQQFITF